MSKGRRNLAFALDGLNMSLGILLAADWTWLGARWAGGLLICFAVARAWVTLSEAYFVKDNANVESN